MELESKRVVITGGSKGLGRALAEAFARRGASVVSVSRHAAEHGHNAIKEIRCDVAKPEQTSAAAEQAEKHLGGIDIWVNNAGVWLPPTMLEELDLVRVREMVEINLLGLIYSTREAVIRMKRQKSGTVVNIISTSALEGRAGQSCYCATKFGAAGFGKAVREEVRGYGVTVFNVYPGGMQTSLFDESRPSSYGSYMDPADVAQKILENLGRTVPEEELVLKRPTA